MKYIGTEDKVRDGLNPCSYGISFLTVIFKMLSIASYCRLNPCSYGISFLTALLLKLNL